MAVTAVIFDVSGTLVRGELSGTPQPGIPEALARLRAAGCALVAAGNHPRRELEGYLRAAGLDFDLVVGRDSVHVNKGSPLWIDHVCVALGCAPHELFYVGDSHYDMITAVARRVVYAHAAWSKPAGRYGLTAPAPAWVPAVVAHIFRKSHNWYWAVDARDGRRHRVRTMAMIDSRGAGDDAIQYGLLYLLKQGRLDARVGPMTMREFVMLHMLASLYGSRLFEETDWWTTYPGHHGAPNDIMGGFLDVAAKLFRRTFVPNLFDRHTPALRSIDAWNAAGAEGALSNQLASLRLNPAYAADVIGKRVLVLDNFLTRGYSTEHARNLLLAGRTQAVVAAAVAKYNTPLHVVSAPDEPWDPTTTIHPNPQRFTVLQVAGSRDADALREFVASYDAMCRERW